jgi:hypothetical protein
MDMCVSYEAMFAAYLLPFTVQPSPSHSRMDLSAVFLRRDSLLKEMAAGAAGVLGVAGVAGVAGAGGWSADSGKQSNAGADGAGDRDGSADSAEGADAHLGSDFGVEQCAGCEAGLLVQRLVHSSLWQYARLPLDGFKSVVFHGPSPAVCAASGNIWFDYPEHEKAGCLSRLVLAKVKATDSKQRPFLDWKNTHSLHKICIRLSEEGFGNMDEIYFNH